MSMKRTVSIVLLLLLSLCILLTGCKTKVSEEPLNTTKPQNTTLSDAKLNETFQKVLQVEEERLVGMNLLKNNEGILNKTSGWLKVKETHNPTELSYEEKKALFETCYWLVRPFVIDNFDKAQYKIVQKSEIPVYIEKDKYPTGFGRDVVESEFRSKYPYSNYKSMVDFTLHSLYTNIHGGGEEYYLVHVTAMVNVTIVDVDSVIYHNTLLCLNGYPVFTDKVIEEIKSSSPTFQSEKALFSINQIFPRVYTESQLIALLGKEKYHTYCIEYKISWADLGDFMWVFDDDVLAEVQGNTNQIVAQTQQETISVTTQTTGGEQQTVKIATTYDFPELGLNKQDIYDAFNYNPTVQKIFSPYNKFGLNLGDYSYTLLLRNGQVIDIKRTIDSDVDFTAKATSQEFKEVISLFKEGKIQEAGMKTISWFPLKIRVILIKNAI